jgi:hypothetical protein
MTRTVPHVLLALDASAGLATAGTDAAVHGAAVHVVVVQVHGGRTVEMSRDTSAEAPTPSSAAATQVARDDGSAECFA